MVQPINMGSGVFWNGRGAGTGETPKLRLMTAEAKKKRQTAVALLGTQAFARCYGKAIASVLIAIALTGALASVVFWAGQRIAEAIAAPAAAATAPLTVSVTVRPGDSLWTLARRYGDPNVYQLDRVDALARANGMPGDTALIAGQRLLVPVSNPVEVARLKRSVAAAANTRQ